MLNEHQITFKVRYPETDGMGVVHHSRYFQYLEMGRIELLRASGISYAQLEMEGILFVVVKVECRYKNPARFDDELTLTTRIARKTHVPHRPRIPPQARRNHHRRSRHHHRLRRPPGREGSSPPIPWESEPCNPNPQSPIRNPQLHYPAALLFRGSSLLSSSQTPPCTASSSSRAWHRVVSVIRCPPIISASSSSRVSPPSPSPSSSSYPPSLPSAPSDADRHSWRSAAECVMQSTW